MSIKVKIDDSYVIFSDQQPRLVQNRTLIPLRGVFEKMGFTVSWTKGTGSNPKGTATLTNSNYRVIVKEGATTFTTNGVTFSHPDGVPAQIIGGRIMLPIRSVLESVGCWVDWDDSTETVIVISIDKMLENFENDTTYQNKNAFYVDTIKKGTLVAVGRALANYGYQPALIAGFLGHITREGNIGQFEKDWGTADQHYLRDWTSVPNLGLPNYTTEYSGKYIMDKNISTVKSILTTLKNNGWPKKFGLGCCQWTEERTPILVNKYYAKSVNFITYDEAVEVEAQMINSELQGSTYSAVVDKWKTICFKENISLCSDDAAYWAGFCVLLGYGLSPDNIAPNNPPAYHICPSPTWVNWAVARGGYAREVYKVMIGKSII